MDRPFVVTAIIAAYNEEDVAGHVVDCLIREGIQVYFIDHGSTDGTVAAVQPFVGRGVIGIEQSPDIGGSRAEGYSWLAVCRRKEALAAEIDSDWFIHHDADEFREGPWRGLNLLESIRQVDAFGYNAIDFELLNFWPTHDRFQQGDDVRESFRRFEFGGQFDKNQIKCWKKTTAPVDLASSGGHDVQFEGRRVFPLRFLLRHYPIRSQAHGDRKVRRERLGRLSKAERAAGFHVQYDHMLGAGTFIRDPLTLVPYDPDGVRLHLMVRHRGVEEVERRLQSQVEATQRLEGRLEETELQHEAEVAALRGRIDVLIDQIRGIQASVVWRVTTPLRWAIARFRRVLP